jgi:hypothetical protein
MKCNYYKKLELFLYTELNRITIKKELEENNQSGLIPALVGPSSH